MIYKQKKKEYSSGNNVLEVIQQSKQKSDEEIVRLNQELEAKKTGEAESFNKRIGRLWKPIAKRSSWNTKVILKRRNTWFIWSCR